MDKVKSKDKDIRILETFISVYCKQNHIKCGVEIYKDGLCRECYDVLEYAKYKREHCTIEEKPMCKHCKIHCYSPNMREKIKKIMRFSGIYFIKHGRFDWILHYFF